MAAALFEVKGGPGKLLGNVESSALGAILVSDGFGSEIRIEPAERKEFPVQLDNSKHIRYTVDGEPEPQSVYIPYDEVGYVSVVRRGQAIMWACHILAEPPARASSSGPGSVASALKPTVDASKPDPNAYNSMPYQNQNKTVHTTAAAFSSVQAGSPQTSQSLNRSGSNVVQAQEALKNFAQYVEEAPHRLNCMCFIGGCAVILYGLSPVLQIFSAFSPEGFVKYTVTVYSVFFGVVTCLTELHPEFAGPLHDSLAVFQKKLHDWAKGLTMLWGRGLFYFFQGSIIAANAGFTDLYGLGIGVYMMFCGFVLGYLHTGSSQGALQENYIRIL